MFDLHENCHMAVICLMKNLNTEFFLATIKATYLTFCLTIISIELYALVPVLMILTYFQSHSDLENVNMKNLFLC